MLEEKLARYVSAIVFEDMDKDTLYLMKRNILDSYAGICASLLDVQMVRRFEALASILPDRRGMTVWGTGRPAHVDEALFMNTILGRRSDLLNTYISPNNMGGSHPSDNIPLVLSIADWQKATGKDVLTAAYAAFVLSCAFADHFNPESGQFDHDALAVFYTALVTGYMLGSSVDQLKEAQRIAGAMGLAIDQAAMGEVTDWKHCTYAACAMRAMASVNMAKAGFRGPVDIFDGEAGVSRFMKHGEEFLDGAPDLKRIIFKRWPALVFVQTPIDVAIAISGEIGDHRMIEHVHVETYRKAIEEAAVSEAAPYPGSRAGRTHSLNYCVVVALLKGNVDISCFEDEYIENNKAINDLAAKISVSEDPAMTGAFPKLSPCRITVTTKDHRTVTRRLDYPHGDPDDPLTDEEIENKALTYLPRVMPGREAVSIIDRIWHMEDEQDVDWLTDPLKRKRLPAMPKKRKGRTRVRPAPVKKV